MTMDYPESSHIKHYDYMQKIIIIGDSGVGKSAIMAKKCDGEFSTTAISTIGVDFSHTLIEVDGKKHNIIFYIDHHIFPS